jgi:hypothetical protein
MVHVLCSSGIWDIGAQGRGFREFNFATMENYMELIWYVEQPTYNDHENVITIDEFIDK